MKIWNYIFIAVTMMMFLSFFGFEVGFTPINQFIGLTMTEGEGVTGISSSPSIWTIIVSTMVSLLLSGSAIFAAALIISRDLVTSFRASVASSILLNFVFTYINILQTIIESYDTWAVAIVSMIFVPLIVLYFISMMDYVTGGTNA